MTSMKSVVWLVSLVSLFLANVNGHVEDVVITGVCTQQARKCALALKYSKCSEVTSRDKECSVSTVCSEHEFSYIFDLACRGEALLASLTRRLDATCVKKLESPECDLGFNPMTLFDFGNISKQYHLCDKVQSSPIAKCLAGNVDYNSHDCTQDQYGSIVDVMCSVGGGASANRPDVHLFSVPACICVLMMTPVALLMSRLSVPECEIP